MHRPIKEQMDRSEFKVNKARKLAEKLSNIYKVDILSRNNKRKNVLPRQALMYLLVKEAGMTLSDTGRVFGRDHATVNYAIKCIRNAEGLNDPASIKTKEYYVSFKDVVKEFANSFKKAEVQEMQAFSEVLTLQEQVDRNNRRIDEAMKLILKIAEDKAKAQKESRQFKREKQELYSKYMEIKSKYEDIGSSTIELEERQRLANESREKLNRESGNQFMKQSGNYTVAGIKFY